MIITFTIYRSILFSVSPNPSWLVKPINKHSLELKIFFADFKGQKFCIFLISIIDELLHISSIMLLWSTIQTNNILRTKVIKTATGFLYTSATQALSAIFNFRVSCLWLYAPLNYKLVNV